MDQAFEGLLRTGGVLRDIKGLLRDIKGGILRDIKGYLGVYLSVANKIWQIYKTNQNKVIDIKKIMLTLQNVADVIKN